MLILILILMLILGLDKNVLDLMVVELEQPNL